MEIARGEGRAVRGDRADGQGVRQPGPPRAARPARAGAAHRARSSRGRASSRRPTPPSTCRRCTPPVWSRASARARACATRSPATRCCALWLALRDASAARLAEVERAARDYLGDDVEAIGREELIARLRRGDAVLVDVRPSEEFEAGHIEGARSIPIEELEQPPGRAARATARSSRTAAARSAPMPTRPFGSCSPTAARPGAWRRAGRNGGSPTSHKLSGARPRQ